MSNESVSSDSIKSITNLPGLVMNKRTNVITDKGGIKKANYAEGETPLVFPPEVFMRNHHRSVKREGHKSEQGEPVEVGEVIGKVETTKKENARIDKELIESLTQEEIKVWNLVNKNLPNFVPRDNTDTRSKEQQMVNKVYGYLNEKRFFKLLNDLFPASEGYIVYQFPGDSIIDFRIKKGNNDMSPILIELKQRFEKASSKKDNESYTQYVIRLIRTPLAELTTYPDLAIPQIKIDGFYSSRFTNTPGANSYYVMSLRNKEDWISPLNDNWDNLEGFVGTNASKAQLTIPTTSKYWYKLNPNVSGIQNFPKTDKSPTIEKPKFKNRYIGIDSESDEEPKNTKKSKK